MKALKVLFWIWSLVQPLSLVGEETKPLPWERLYDRDKVEVFRASIEGSRFVAFRGKTWINVQPQTIVDVFNNSARWKEWTDLLISGHVIKHHSARHKVFYQSFSSPPFIADRDAVYEVKVTDTKTGGLRVVGLSIDYPDAPETIGVRMSIKFSRWKLEPHEGGTLVDLEIHADPGGSIPSWLVNMVQRDYPYNLLSSLRSHAQSLKPSKISN